MKRSFLKSFLVEDKGHFILNDQCPIYECAGINRRGSYWPYPIGIPVFQNKKDFALM